MSQGNEPVTDTMLAGGLLQSLEVWPCLASLLISFCFSAGWALWRFRSINDTTTIPGRALNWTTFGAITYAGPLALQRWDIGAPGAQLASSWAVGFAGGVALVWTVLSIQLASAAAALPLRYRAGAAGAAAIALVKVGLIRAQAEVQKYAKQIQKQLEKQANHQVSRLLEAAECLHDYIHSARDRAPWLRKQRAEALEQYIFTHQDPEQCEAEIREILQKYFQTILSDLCKIFQAQSKNGAKVWIAIRRVEGENGRKVYKTLAREPARYDSRSSTSEGIPENCGLPKYLRNQLERGDGVIYFADSRTRGRNRWMKTANDERSEDKSQLVAPICKMTDGEREVAMILYVNSTEPKAFPDTAKPFLKCCSDVLSAVVLSDDSISVQERAKK